MMGGGGGGDDRSSYSGGSSIYFIHLTGEERRLWSMQEHRLQSRNRTAMVGRSKNKRAVGGSNGATICHEFKPIELNAI
jgi:hypothetical protein